MSRAGDPSRLLTEADRERLHAYLARDPYAHLFHLADLDEPYAPFARWFVRGEGPVIAALAMLYTWPETPVLQLIEPDNPQAAPLLRDILPSLPARVYCQVTEGIPTLLSEAYAFESLQPFLKMRWVDKGALSGGLREDVTRLTREHEGILRSFEPAVWFEPRMFDHGFYYGVFDQGRLVSVAGTPVLSRRYGVAVIGGVGTLESHRGRGLAARLVSTLVATLRKEFRYIGLNVRADNVPAIRCYEKCGFERHGSGFWDGVAVRK